MAEEKGSITGSTLGPLFVSESDGSLVPKGNVTANVRKMDKFDFVLEIMRGSDLLIAQPINAEMDLYFSGNQQMEWILRRPSKADQRLRLATNDPEHKFRIAVSQALFEATTKQSLEAAIESSDRDWALQAAIAEDIDVQDEDDFNYSGAQKSNAMIDEDDEPEDDGKASAYRTPAKGGSSSSRNNSAIKTSTRKGKEQNSILVSGMNLNRSFVSRGSQLGVFGYSNDDEVVYMNRIPSVKDASGEVFTPAKLQLHSADRQLLLLNSEKKDRVYNMDLETGKVVDEWEGEDGMTIRNIAPRSKYAQTTSEQVVIGVNERGLFTLDPRLNTKNKVAEKNFYANKVHMNSASATGSGLLAVASDKGDIRLYDKLDKRAKTSLPGLGNAVTNVDVTEDGAWILATTKTYLMVFPTTMKNGKDGFSARMGEEKPVPIKLSITPEDIIRYGIKEVNLTPARFNTGTLANAHEEWITTSTGEFVVTWNFLKVKKGNKSAYKIQKTHANVVTDLFRHNYSNEIVVAQANDVFMSKLSKGNN